ncbi:MAG TPA: TetR/AcrR family transcriptional regulator [Pseudonocardiaceae bacterium]|nr:TetR/AcrR family transcriptional regulator [Pseudonocardiaceae bacterium]
MESGVRPADRLSARRAGAASGSPADRRLRILEAAARTIEQHGPDAAIGLVAEAAGLARPHLYRHFASNDDLDREVARYATRQLAAWIRPALTAPGTPLEILRGIIGRTVAWAADHPNLYRFRVRLRQAPVVTELSDAAFAYLRAAGYTAQLPAQVVASVVGMVDASTLWWLDHRDQLDSEALTGQVVGQVWLVLSDAMQRLGRPMDANTRLVPDT